MYLPASSSSAPLILRQPSLLSAGMRRLSPSRVQMISGLGLPDARQGTVRFSPR